MSTQQHTHKDPISSYLGISFAIFLTSLPKHSLSLIPYLQTHNKSLSKKLLNAENQLQQLYSRRKEDSKANARVVEIFASHRNTWQQEEKRLLRQIDDDVEEIASLRAKVEDLEVKVDELQKEVSERDELLNYMTNNRVVNDGDDGCDGEFYGKFKVLDESVDNNDYNVKSSNGAFGDNYNVDDLGSVYDGHDMFNPSGFLGPAVSKFFAERSNSWQGVRYEPVEPVHDLKHYVTRRESPWKVDGDSSGISAKLKLLEQELQNLENIDANDSSNVPSSMKKQAKRYQALAGKIDDLCRRMQENDPCEPNAGLEFRTQRQTEFLLEALRLQQHASETGQKLIALQAETGTGCNYSNNLVERKARLTTSLSLNSIRNNFRDIQRNLEIWLARIIGGVEGILTRDGTSRVSEYFVSQYPFVKQEIF